MLKLTFSLLITTLFILSCNQHQGASDVTISLDNGERWIANAYTTTGVNQMITLTEAQRQNPAGVDYAQLKDGLENEFKLIFKNCTMKGEAHNQLHNYLLPMQSLFDALGDKDPDVQKTALDQLSQHLAMYSEYFQ